jgi:hypothetical protein
MAFYTYDLVAKIDEVASFEYIDMSRARRWNEHRRDGELRLLTGWQWIAKDGSTHRQGFKTKSVAMRDAFYSLIEHREAPVAMRRVRLRVAA